MRSVSKVLLSLWIVSAKGGFSSDDPGPNIYDPYWSLIGVGGHELRRHLPRLLAEISESDARTLGMFRTNPSFDVMKEDIILRELIDNWPLWKPHFPTAIPEEKCNPAFLVDVAYSSLLSILRNGQADVFQYYFFSGYPDKAALLRTLLSIRPDQNATTVPNGSSFITNRLIKALETLLREYPVDFANAISTAHGIGLMEMQVSFEVDPPTGLQAYFARVLPALDEFCIPPYYALVDKLFPSGKINAFARQGYLRGVHQLNVLSFLDLAADEFPFAVRFLLLHPKPNLVYGVFKPNFAKFLIQILLIDLGGIVDFGMPLTEETILSELGLSFLEQLSDEEAQEIVRFLEDNFIIYYMILSVGHENGEGSYRSQLTTAFLDPILLLEGNHPVKVAVIHALTKYLNLEEHNARLLIHATSTSELIAKFYTHFHHPLTREIARLSSSTINHLRIPLPRLHELHRLLSDKDTQHIGMAYGSKFVWSRLGMIRHEHTDLESLPRLSVAKLLEMGLIGKDEGKVLQLHPNSKLVSSIIGRIVTGPIDLDSSAIIEELLKLDSLGTRSVFINFFELPPSTDINEYNAKTLIPFVKSRLSPKVAEIDRYMTDEYPGLYQTNPELLQHLGISDILAIHNILHSQGPSPANVALKFLLLNHWYSADFEGKLEGQLEKFIFDLVDLLLLRGEMVTELVSHLFKAVPVLELPLVATPQKESVIFERRGDDLQYDLEFNHALVFLDQIMSMVPQAIRQNVVNEFQEFISRPLDELLTCNSFTECMKVVTGDELSSSALEMGEEEAVGQKHLD